MVVAGGTGGHFYPGLSVAKTFLSKGHAVHFIVRKSDYVLPLLQRENIPYSEISAAGFRRSLHISNFIAPFLLLKGFLESFSHVKNFQPDVLHRYLCAAD
jgi:UDP-N-acetylglucosamine--N-acetylmuramyl-(pentapeptide) pyrophosphoryl-undecaprenol N-acetylglucosamine transferase